MRTMALALLVFSGFGCGDDGFVTDAGVPDRVEARIGSAGGTIALGGASVEIPEGALSSTVTITVSRYPAANLPAAPTDREPAGDAFAFEPHGLAFAVPVTLRLPFTGPSERLELWRLDDEDDTTWGMVESTVVGDVLEHSATTFSIDRPHRQSGVIILPLPDSGRPDAREDDGGEDPMDASTDATTADAAQAMDAANLNDAAMDAAPSVEAGTDASLDATVDAGVDAGTDAGSLLTISEQEVYIKASNTGATDTFGFSSALSGDTLVVGAPYEASAAQVVDGDQANNGAAASGAAYVFVRSGGTWIQQAYLKGSNTDASDLLGYSVAVSGDTVVVGSRNAAGMGSAYVFVRNGATWSEQAVLQGSHIETGDSFGDSVGISGDTVVVGAWGDDSGAVGVGGDGNDNSVSRSGAAYVFVRSGTTWTQQAYLKASNTGVDDRFGWRVAIDGTTIVAGAWGERSNATGVNGDQLNNSLTDSGAAYVFTRSGVTWTQQAYLKASNTGDTDSFGTSVAISGNTIAVGAYNEGSNATGVDGDGSNNLLTYSGAAYVFAREGTTWTQQAYVKPTNTGGGDGFGNSVALFGDTLVVGNAGEDSHGLGFTADPTSNAAQGSGAIYVYSRNGSTWSPQVYVKASNAEGGDGFGCSVAVNATHVVAGACAEDSSAVGIGGDQASNAAPGSGAIYVMR